LKHKSKTAVKQDIISGDDVEIIRTVESLKECYDLSSINLIPPTTDPIRGEVRRANHP
jgi:hypothetical protein